MAQEFQTKNVKSFAIRDKYLVLSVNLNMFASHK